MGGEAEREGGSGCNIEAGGLITGQCSLQITIRTLFSDSSFGYRDDSHHHQHQCRQDWRQKGLSFIGYFFQLMHINTKTASHASWNCFHSGNLLSLLERWKSICCWVGKLGPDYYCFNWHLAFNWLRTKNWITQTLIGKRSGIFYVYVQLNLGVFSSRPEICEHETGLVQP